MLHHGQLHLFIQVKCNLFVCSPVPLTFQLTEFDSMLSMESHIQKVCQSEYSDFSLLLTLKEVNNMAPSYTTNLLSPHSYSLDPQANVHLQFHRAFFSGQSYIVVAARKLCATTN